MKLAALNEALEMCSHVLGASSLLEARSGLTMAEVGSIQSLLNGLRSLGPDGMDEAELEANPKKGTFMVMNVFRNWDFFRARPDEEDDDFPDFVGFKKAEKIVKSALGNLAKKVKIEIGAEEKAWFSVYISGTLDTTGMDMPFEDRPLSVQAFNKEFLQKFIDEFKKQIDPQWKKLEKKIGHTPEGVNPRFDVEDWSSSKSMRMEIRLPSEPFESGGYVWANPVKVVVSADSSSWRIYATQGSTSGLGSSKTIFDKKGKSKTSSYNKLMKATILMVKKGLKAFDDTWKENKKKGYVRKGRR